MHIYVHAYVEKLRLYLPWFCFYFLLLLSHFVLSTQPRSSHTFWVHTMCTCVGWWIALFSHACLHAASHHSFQFISAPQAVLFCSMRKDNQQNKFGALWLTLVFVTQGNPNEGTNKILPRKTFLTISITVLIGWVWLPDYPLISTRMLFGKQLKYALHGSSLHPFSTF